MKDNFSLQSNQYVKFRPTYPHELYDYIQTLIQPRQCAWDCGTGNGQVAQELANYFDKVYATDISEKQIENAVQKSNIIYKVESAEKTSFANNSFDLITVAQAIHWFNFGEFYKEVERTIKPNGILAVIGYGLIQTNPSTDIIISDFYHNIVGPYWDKERRYIDENYETIPFPFKEFKAPKFKHEFQWTFEQIIGYLLTWSAVQHYRKEKNTNPVDLIAESLRKSWGDKKTVNFPILLRVGEVEKKSY
jgi:ubiquinone/menaquinone biosynthesis C-methylase UbiE